MKIDLHCHTTVSDGHLTPLELLQRAEEQSVQLLAITDHDTVGAYQQLLDVDSSVALVSGIELSSQWANMSVHIVGLGIDLSSSDLQDFVAEQQSAREQRGEMIAKNLVKKGLPDLLPAAKEIAGVSQLGRPHFAQAMIDKEIVKTQQAAFKRYLGAGKAGDVKASWPHISEVVEKITAFGGVAILAHPLHYKITQTKRRALIADFKAVGGEAIEVISGRQSSQETDYLKDLCYRFQLEYSCGSDFHRPSPWSELGVDVSKLDQDAAVWSRWV